MLIFPEGTRSTDGELHEFKPLLGHLALTYGVDILPLYLGGTREAMPKGEQDPAQARDLEARIGPPITLTDMRRLTQGPLRRRRVARDREARAPRRRSPSVKEASSTSRA